MKEKGKLFIIGILITGMIVGILIGRGMRGVPEKGHVHKEGEVSQEKKIKYWTCSMHPQIKLPKPGKCPICAMDLIPVMEGVEEESEEGVPALTLGPVGMRLAEIETTPVEYREVSHVVRMVGKVDYDESKLAHIAAWVSGRIDKLYVDFTGTKVKKGGHLVYIYSPELLSVQEEYLQAIRNLKEVEGTHLDIIRETARDTLINTREKLRLYGITSEQIEEIEKKGEASDHMNIYSPISGTVIHKHGFEGMYVKTGTRIYTIADLNQVWVYLDAYESDLPWVRYGQKAAIVTEAYPGEIFHGKIAFIDPFLNEKTRTVKLRINVENPQGKLKPGMFVRAKIESVLADEGVLVIPQTAPLITGKRAIVYVDEGEVGNRHRYVGREIVLGPRAGDWYVVREGLKKGEKVVTQGNFKIDSALQIHAKPSMMSPAGYYGEKEGETEEKETAVAKTEIPEELKDKIEELLKNYLKIQKALVKDDKDSAFQELKNFKAVLDASLRHKVLAEIHSSIHHLPQEDLKNIRESFSNISLSLRNFLDKYENPLKPLYLAFCPMSLDGEKGYWFQKEEKIANPYLGSAMPRCGTIEKEY